MRLRQLWLTDFRSYRELDLTFPEGLTCIVGENGIGKTNLLEAIGYLIHLKSFRGADNAAMVNLDAPRAVVRGVGSSKGRELLIEAELPAESPETRHRPVGYPIKSHRLQRCVKVSQAPCRRSVEVSADDARLPMLVGRSSDRTNLRHPTADRQQERFEMHAVCHHCHAIYGQTAKITLPNRLEFAATGSSPVRSASTVQLPHPRESLLSDSDNNH